MNKKYSVGIIGAGAIVEAAHIPVLKAIPDISIAWVYDSNINRSNLLSKMFHVPVIREGNVVTALDDIDICLLTIPYGARKNYIELCATKKKALYVEKPFAVSTKEHVDWCSLFAPNELAIGFQRRYYRTAALLKQITCKELFGKLKRINFNQGFFALKGNKPFLSDAALSGGGVIIESAIHTLDQLLMITGAESVMVKEVKSLQKNGIDYDSFFNTVLSCPVNEVDVTSVISSLRNLQNGVQFFFEQASVYCGMSADEKIKIFDNTGQPIQINIDFSDNKENSRAAGSVDAAFYYFWKEFIEAIATNAVNKTSAINSLLTTSWIEQVYSKINHTG